jgi:DNA primase
MPRYDRREMSDEERQALNQERERESRRRRVFTAVTQVYHEALLDAEEARAYLSARGFSEAVAETWRLGWAPRVGGADLVLANGISELDALETALVRRRDGSLEPWCAGRVVIPFLEAGETIYFTGRAVDEGVSPKYLHIGGPVPVFNSDALWGEDRLLVVEGPFDVIRLAQLGHKAVAICGKVLDETM